VNDAYTARWLERAVTEFGFRSAWIMPSLVGQPPNYACYFPVYTKCVEFGIWRNRGLKCEFPVKQGKYRKLREFRRENGPTGEIENKPPRLGIVPDSVPFPAFFSTNGFYWPKMKSDSRLLCLTGK
jgi:hypothetical protein